ncbi:MAG: two-component sensor histidine kinase, partial [Polyangiaceae bacterium]|nr:two-component sensor histidine kinase [Polyangiaceae bacterium]
LVRAAVTLFEPLAAESGISVSVHEDGSIKAPVDPGQVHQVVTNLLVNALQAQPNGGAVRLSIGSATAASLDGGAAAHAVIAVEDDGPGIAPELRERIFEPFFTTKDVGEGTGLGLSVAYGIVREHGGFFEVGAPQRGSRFEVHLPMGGA